MPLEQIRDYPGSSPSLLRTKNTVDRSLDTSSAHRARLSSLLRLFLVCTVAWDSRLVNIHGLAIDEPALRIHSLFYASAESRQSCRLILNDSSPLLSPTWHRRSTPEGDSTARSLLTCVFVGLESMLRLSLSFIHTNIKLDCTRLEMPSAFSSFTRIVLLSPPPWHCPFPPFAWEDPSCAINQER